MSQKRQLNLTINDKQYLVEVDDLHASPLLVRVNGREYRVTVNNQQLTVNSQQSTTTAQPAPIQNPKSKIRNSVSAPMPGNIIRIGVQAGDSVSVGQTLCFLEAMKMQNAIRSPREGVIASVDVDEGTAVAHGDKLFTFAD